MMSSFLAPKPHCKKLNALTLFVRLSSTKMLVTIATPSIEVVAQCLKFIIRRQLNTFKNDPIQTHPQQITKLIITELYDWNNYDINHSKSLLNGYFILRQLKSECI